MKKTGNVARGRCAAAILLALALTSRAAPLNLLVNPDFERVYAAQRLSATNLPGARTEHKLLPGYAGAAFLPYGWAIIPRQDGQGMVEQSMTDGRRCESGCRTGRA